jgi:uncharacterized protein YgiM (DUF1202 family)
LKRVFFLTVLALVLCLLCACAEPVEEPVDGDAGAEKPASAQPVQVGIVVDTDNVNLRVAPDQEARIIDNVLAGTMLEVIGEESEDGWYQVVARGELAYVYAEFLYVKQYKLGEEVTVGTVLKDKDQVELRSATSATAEVLTKAVRYQRFIVLQENVDDKWCKVDYKGEPAYLPQDSLELETLCIKDLLL